MKNKNSMKKAFSLMELAIVLIIIGIIIAAVMAGGEIIKNAESKQFYQSFARKWSTVIDMYYDRMGSHITDSTLHEGTQPLKDGYFDGVTLTATQISQIKSSGINIEKIIGTNQSLVSTYSIQGEFTDYVLVSVHLGAYKFDGVKYNFLILRNVPVDIAVAIDRYIDGVSDGTKGNAIVIQTTPANLNLPTNLSNTDLNTLALDYSQVTTTTKTTNIGIIVEH